MPTQVSVLLKSDGESWTVNGIREETSSHNSMDYDELSLSSDISEVTYSDFLECNQILTSKIELEVEAVVLKPLTDVTNKVPITESWKISKMSRKKNAKKPTVSKKVVTTKQKKHSFLMRTQRFQMCH